MTGSSLRTLMLGVAFGAVAAVAALADPLPSWSDTDSKARIIAFVDQVTDPASDSYVPPADRIATFDNDGTLWAEQPVYFQLIYAIDRIGEMAAQDPSLLDDPVLKAAAEKDYDTLIQGGTEALGKVVAVSHMGPVDAFEASVANWLATARHPQTGMAYDTMTYQPMVELLRYLRDEEFKTYIVSGGGIHFMRVFAEQAYGIPNEQVIGTYTETEYVVENGVPVIVKKPGIAFVNDKAGKAINIDRIIGKRPILAGGNSDGDFAMLEYSTAGDGARLGLLIHHTDGDREYAYDRDSHIGQLVDGLDKGPDMGWLIVDMAQDWQRVYTGGE